MQITDIDPLELEKLETNFHRRYEVIIELSHKMLT